MAKPNAQKAMPAVMKSIMFLAITLATERDLMEPASTRANPACMKKTMNAADRVQAKLTAASASLLKVSPPPGSPPPAHATPDRIAMVKSVMPKPISTILIGQDLVITCANTPKTGRRLGWSRHEEIGIGGPSQSLSEVHGLPMGASRPVRPWLYQIVRASCYPNVAAV